MTAPTALARALESASVLALWPALCLFPLHAIRPGPTCACWRGAECGRIGKHPAVSWSEAELGPAQKIRSEDPSAGYGIATGARSGVIVIDLDGHAAVERAKALGTWPETLTVERAPGHEHRYFRAPDFEVRNSAGALAKGIDVRGDGGFVVAPGSPHRSGETYRVTRDVPPVDAPAWLLAWPGLRRVHVARNVAPAHEVEARVGATVPRDWRIERARAWLATRRPAIQGNGGDGHTWRTLLTAIKQFALTDADMVEAAFAAWNARCIPPWSGNTWSRNIERAIASKAVPWTATIGLAYETTTMMAQWVTT